MWPRCIRRWWRVFSPPPSAPFVRVTASASCSLAATRLAAPTSCCAAPAEWAAWQVYFGDERCTPRDDALRNSRMAESAWLGHVPLARSQVHEMPAELGPREAASRYRTVLEAVGDFDLVLLGLGEDGHTGSLFPGHELGRGAGAPSVLPVFDAPKPPAQRVTISAHRFSRAAEVIFLVAGAGKREAVRRWRAGEAIPAQAIAPAAGVDVFVEASLLLEPPGLATASAQD